MEVVGSLITVDWFDCHVRRWETFADDGIIGVEAHQQRLIHGHYVCRILKQANKYLFLFQQ